MSARAPGVMRRIGAPVRRLWTALTRPRGHVRHRFYRVGRGSRAGVALLMVITSILLLTVLVTEIAHSATVRIKLAAAHRDEVKAEALATTGINLYRLILMASKQIGKNPMIQQAGAFMGINGDAIWQLLPAINTNLMRLILVSGGDLDEDEVAQPAELTDDEIAMSREERSAMRRNFLDFDGDFSASVTDESRFIFIGNLQATSFAQLSELPAAIQLQALMNREEDRTWYYENNLEPLELIGNLVDWTDMDNTRIYQGGGEDTLYQRLESPYLPKNAPFDSIDEIRLVEGWHLDGVWERVGQHVTIYGKGQVNVNTADREVMRALLMAYSSGGYNEYYIDQAVDELMRWRSTPVAEGGVHFSSGQHFVTFVGEQLAASVQLRDDAQNAVTTESEVFRVQSAGEVGNTRVEITAVIDYSQNQTGAIVYWKTE